MSQVLKSNPSVVDRFPLGLLRPVKIHGPNPG